MIARTLGELLTKLLILQYDKKLLVFVGYVKDGRHKTAFLANITVTFRVQWNADAGERAAGPGFSSVMLEDFRRIVKQVIRDSAARVAGSSTFCLTVSEALQSKLN